MTDRVGKGGGNFTDAINIAVSATLHTILEYL
jgi:hypothetical protein